MSANHQPTRGASKAMSEWCKTMICLPEGNEGVHPAQRWVATVLPHRAAHACEQVGSSMQHRGEYCLSLGSDTTIRADHERAPDAPTIAGVSSSPRSRQKKQGATPPPLPTT